MGLDRLSTLPARGPNDRARRINCGDYDDLRKILLALAHGDLKPEHRDRALNAAMLWLETEQRRQKDTREGMARMMLDAAERVGAASRQ